MKLNTDDEAAQKTNQETDDDSHTPESIMTSATVDGTPFSVLMSQAIKIKSAQDAPTRSDYDKYPTFYKNSIFPRDEVINARQKPFVDRMADALKFKREGNQAFDEKRYFDAITKYEMALSVFKYLENVNQNWKTEVRLMEFTFALLYLPNEMYFILYFEDKIDFYMCSCLCQ